MGELAIIKSGTVLSPGDIEVLKNAKFKGFTDAEISYASAVCNHLQLNPLLNQIHFVKRNSNNGTATITTQVGIDGFRLAAERTGKYAGNDEPIFDIPEGSKFPRKATVTVYKMLDGQRCAFTASALWDEYYPGEGGQGAMWRKMPCGQLSKCAEALALRKAFPAELAAIRTDEEMAQAEVEPKVSKAQSLNARAAAPVKEQAPIVDAEIVEERPAEKPAAQQQTASNEAPFCEPCNRTMLVSKFDDKDLGATPWYCPKCKAKKARAS